MSQPKKIEQMLTIFVCRSLVCHKHDAMSDSHANSITKTTHVTTHFLVEPNLRGGFQDFHQRVPQFCYRQPNVARSFLHTSRSTQDSKLLFSHFLQRTSQPLPALWNSATAKFFQFGSRCIFLLRHPTHCHHKTTIILQFFPLLMHINEIIPHRSTTSQTNVGMCNSQDLTESPYRDRKRCNKCWWYLFVDPWYVTTEKDWTNVDDICLSIPGMSQTGCHV